MMSDAQKGEFSIQVDVTRGLATIELRGFWDDTVLSAYESAIRSEYKGLARAGCPTGEHVVLVDVRGFVVQSQDMLSKIQSVVNDPAHIARRTAIVVDRALLTIQARRVSPRFRYFRETAEALAWLTGP